MDTTFDFVIIGAGPAGEAAAHKARELGATVAVVDRRWFGGSCPHIGCLPSKSLLHGAAEHHANPAALRLAAGLGASRLHDQPRRRRRRARRHAATSSALEDAGAVVYRGDGAHRRPRAGRGHATTGSRHELAGRRTSSSRSARVSQRSPIAGIDDIDVWTNEQATLTRELPRSLLVLGGGPTGCELAQVYARFGVPTTIVQSGPRLAPTDHPRNSEVVRATLEGGRRDGPDRRPRRGARGPAPGADGAHVIELDDGSTAEGHAILLARRPRRPARRPRASSTTGSTRAAGRRPTRATAGCASPTACAWSATPAGPELHTHQAHYQGELAVRMALGEAVEPDYRALPRATYTDPEAAFVGVSLEAAREAGLDAFELVADFAKSNRGLRDRGRRSGHVTIVVDRAHARAGRRGDGLPGRVGRDPRVRAGDQGARHGRRPGRHDPRLPVDVADLQRPVRRRARRELRPNRG